MPQVNRSALVPYSAQQMYQLVNDVSAYPTFLPGCIGSRILELTPESMTAAVDIAKAGISKTFTTRNTLFNNRKIEIQLIEGPFRKLVGDWHFTPLSDGACKVELYLDFEFANQWVDLVFGQIFKELAGNMLQAFIHRAKEVYCV